MKLAQIQNRIYEIRGKRAMLDKDLAELYQVATSHLNRAVKRNMERFPERFMFQLTEDEILIYQNGTSSWGGTRSLSYAFTKQGVSMLSAVLKSKIAINVSISIMDAFVAMREYISNTNLQSAEIREIREKIKVLELNNEDTLGAVNDLSEDLRKDIENIYLAIGELSTELPTLNKPRNLIGYVNNSEKKK